MIKYKTESPEETIELASKIGAVLRKGDVIAYRGGLGAGKTTFTRGLAIGAGLEDEVTSPTFALINEYHGNLDIYHFDMYRIEGTDDLETTGFFDYPMDESVFVIEWSENISEILPENTIYIEIKRTGDESREIIIEGDERFADIRN
ncbi:MAG: tRNA (adenosine(37)-N6)-threonylcarbamoyltransferase complex ATPase subunit type 1 TsaE [Oscillospiraceae bacterium]|nr:tRNA (adenosine(37)-N6)-threonylcarbamoyltransferase complex ATPase subunit type 1 TsaE [Oscillospiraceae bacterium]MDD6083730.1 tRNA (adenosine(37)-N6)-threonylcarbamoyltransferase complex ATPase subunit type 1 TsaE [Oscillospiraceae bacterium]